MNPSIVTVVLATILLKQVVSAFDFCQKNLNCPANAKHVGCGSTNNFGRYCPVERTLVPMTAELKAHFLKKHNQARSDIANGKITGYKSANRMIEMTWDDELAKLAEYNAKSCTYGHDECRNTATYKYAGQNIAMVMSTPNYFETIKAVDYLFGLWFDEYKDCDMTYINKYRPSDTDAQIGHFTQIVSAGANRVGCAVTTFADSRKNVYIVCNYSLTNILARPIYTTGTPCSACTKGCSATYPGLCNSSEVIPLV
ncbi:antigen 5 like allergen Cul n 1-like [Bradysia coprophila]|uniref:antigen 5 like allergen Cul n 1-like n=1 Tax=Bradysia coprophila TaxID=38358 RepID=UPI00187DDA17|nr:antigen 5 like allergen Cul n 1-like [Bradysia coprophila]